MKCPICQFQNEADAKFCNKCGSKLEVTCPSCGKPNRLDSQFCKECGYNIALPARRPPKELSLDEKIAKIQKYLPKGLTEKILSQRDRIEGERKQVTVMFCDMEGFTPLVEKLGPEEAYSIMDQVYEILIHKVHDYEGTVNEMTGDGIMALFGAPIALEDAPQRAIRSAHSIHREMTRFNQKLKEDGKEIPLLRMRIGIHTGPVVVGTLGNDLRVEFKAVGDTVNLASRVESLTEPGTTSVTEDTFRLTEGLFRFEALGERQAKGIERSIRVYRVIAPSTRRTRFDVSAERGLTPFVGRQREVELLLDGLERVKTGHGQAFSIVSEAGLGKSRLLYEFRKAISNEDVTFLEGKCLSYGRGLSYHPIVDILKSNFDIQEEDGDATIRDKVRLGLAILEADEPSILPYLLEILSVKDSGIDKIMMSPEGKKDQIIEALKQIVLRGSQIRPLVLAVEDLHWADRSSEDVLKELLSAIPGARVFLLFTYRPEFVPTWGAKSYQSQITLNRLSNRESVQMAEYVLGSNRISPPLEEIILEKGEGVPFFVEEFVKSLEHLKIIEKDESTYRLAKDSQEIGIPSTIQDVIMARVDTLPDAAKDVLQIGSVTEREFSDELIRRVAGIREHELVSSLSALKDSELIFERGISPHLTYVFKHALTRDVINDSILMSRRRKLHDRIARAMEEIYQENLDEHYGVLANHFMEAESYSKAAKYSKLAAKKSQRGGALKDAINYGEKLVSILEKLSEADHMEKEIIDARATLGLYYNQTNNFVEAKEAVEPIVDLAIKHNYTRRLGQIHTILGEYIYVVEEDLPKASKKLQEAISVAEATGDLISLVMANHWMGHVSADNCEFDKSLQHLNKGLQINTMANVLWGISVHKSCIARTVHLNRGNGEKGYAMSLEGLQTAEESGDSYSKAEAHLSMGVAYFQKRRLGDAKQHLLMSCDICERMQLFPAIQSSSEGNLGEMYFSIGQYSKSKEHYINMIRILNSNSLAPSWCRTGEIALARAMVMNNEKIAKLDTLFTYIDENNIKLVDGRNRRCLAEIFLHFDGAHLQEAEKWIHGAVEADRRNGLFFELAMDLTVCGKVYKQRDDRSKAREAVREAISVFQQCGADGWVKKCQEDLGSLS